jgi:hypothetical protein
LERDADEHATSRRTCGDAYRTHVKCGSAARAAVAGR